MRHLWNVLKNCSNEIRTNEIQVEITKGQIISECPYEIIICPKIATKKFPGFLPWPLRRGQNKNFIKPIMLNNP